MVQARDSQACKDSEHSMTTAAAPIDERQNVIGCYSLGMLNTCPVLSASEGGEVI